MKIENWLPGLAQAHPGNAPGRSALLRVCGNSLNRSSRGNEAQISFESAELLQRNLGLFSHDGSLICLRVSSHMNKTLVVVPTYNERENLPPLCQRLFNLPI